MRSIVFIVAAILALVCLTVAYKPFNPHINRPSPYNPTPRRTHVYSDRAVIEGNRRIQKLFVEKAKKSLKKFDKKALKQKLSAKWKNVKKALKQKKATTAVATLAEKNDVVNSFVKCQACKYGVELAKKKGPEFLQSPEVRRAVCSRFPDDKQAYCEIVLVGIAKAIEQKVDPAKICAHLKFCKA